MKKTSLLLLIKFTLLFSLYAQEKPPIWGIASMTFVVMHSMEDVSKISEKGNLLEIVSPLKEQKVARHIGFSGHADANAMETVAERGDFDAMLIAINNWDYQNNPQQRQDRAIPVALKKRMGVLVMKAIRPWEKYPDLKPRELVRYAPSLDGPAGVSLGIDNIDVVKSNIEILRNFKNMIMKKYQICQRS